MNGFLITTTESTSEWMASFESVENEMNELEKSGVVSDVNVSKYVNGRQVKSITYDFDGEKWIPL